jgi:hypothetical protein
VEKKMSAWLCSENHLSLIALHADHPPAAFKMLLAENLRSLEARYPGRDFLEEWKQEAAKYRFQDQRCNRLKATLIVKQCDCYDYQACETDDYKTTKAARLVERVRTKALEAGGAIKGAAYDACPWGID